MRSMSSNKVLISALVVTMMIAALALACAADTCTLMSGVLGDGACSGTTIGAALPGSAGGTLAVLLAVVALVASGAAAGALRGRPIPIVASLAVVPAPADTLHGRLRL